jgi:CelD/BcsL family acetyltransferase involved in cellulose biosynthesis
MCAIADHLALDADHWDVINLINLYRKDEISRFQNALLNCSLPFQLAPELEGSPYLVLETGSPAIMRRISAQGRRKLRKEIEAAALAGMKVRIIENPENENGLINKLADLEQKKSRFLKVEPFISRYPKEFQSIVNTMGPRSLLYIALLEQEETPIAFQLGFRCGSKLWGYVGAYDPSFARSSPGKLLLPHIWDYGCSHGYDEFDFLSGEEPYKMRWSTGCREKFRMRIWNRHYISRFDKWLYENVRSLFQNTTSSFRRGWN